MSTLIVVISFQGGFVRTPRTPLATGMDGCTVFTIFTFFLLAILLNLPVFYNLKVYLHFLTLFSNARIVVSFIYNRITGAVSEIFQKEGGVMKKLGEG